MFPDGIDEAIYVQFRSEYDENAVARSGDLNYLQIIQREFGGMFFNPGLVKISLENHQFEFFRQYVLLCAPNLLKNDIRETEQEGFESGDEQDSDSNGGNSLDPDDLYEYEEEVENPTDDWMECRSDLFPLILNSKISPELRLKVLIELIDEIFPNFPKREEIQFPTGFELGNGGPCYPPEYPLWEDPDYPNMTKPESFALLLYLSDSFQNFHILKYFCEQCAVRFSQHFLHRCRGIYYIEMLEYILNHVDDGVDIEPYRDAGRVFNDREFVEYVVARSRASDADNRLEYEEAKFRFKHLFYKREEMLRRGLAVVHGLIQYLHDNLDRTARSILYILWYQPDDLTLSSQKAKAQKRLNFLIEAFDEIISEQLTQFPVIGTSIADLLPDEIEKFMIPLRY